MTDNIPISFDHKGSHFEGFFSEMTNGSHWHLMINNYYYGQLIYSEVHGFRFSSNKGYFEDLSEFFGEHIRNWRKQNLQPVAFKAPDIGPNNATYFPQESVNP